MHLRSKIFCSLFVLCFGNVPSFVCSSSSPSTKCSIYSSHCSDSESIPNHHSHHHQHPNASSRQVNGNRQRAVRRKQGNRLNWMTTTTTTTTTTTVPPIETVHTEPTKKIISPCSMEAFESCLALMRDVMQNSSLAFPTNVHELRNTCRKLKAGDYCAERYIRSCAGDQQRLLYQDIVHGTKNVIRLICQQGDTQTQYLKFASCFKDISESEQRCAPVLRRFQRTSDLLTLNPDTATDSDSETSDLNNIHTLSDDDKLMHFCCSYRDVVDCQTINVRKYCGEGGLEFFDRYNGEMTGPLIKEHCVGYTYGESCIKTQSANSSPNDKQQHSLSADSNLNDNSSASQASNTLLLFSLVLLSTSPLYFIHI